MSETTFVVPDGHAWSAQRSRVDGNISDLFFNTDLNETKVYGPDGFEEFDEAKLRQEATDFLSSLERLNVAVPTVDDLIADFYARL